MIPLLTGKQLEIDTEDLHGAPAPSALCRASVRLSGVFHVGAPFKFSAMSGLYVRIKTSFYTHRKTVKLRIKLGNDALWVVPRLWAYAAENQPDGNMSKYSSEELAHLLGCPSNAKCMLQALTDCGFIDENGFIHDWNEHNGYHFKFSERAKIAARARWDKEKSPTPPKEKETGKGKGETSIASPMLQASENSEIPTESEAVRLTMNLAIPEDFSIYVYGDWSCRDGKDAAGQSVAFIKYVSKRWSRERNEWLAKNHKGNKVFTADGKPKGKSLLTKIIEQA